MNYIIWRNKDSRNISGLLISKLPPFTFPKRKTLLYNVDGIDGDLSILDLGFESIEQKIEIGLYGDFDINEIMEYFSVEDDELMSDINTIIYSNEPDKFRYATMIDSIDYEKLLRFKTAEITFRVQPYKYKIDESILNDFPTNPIVVENLGNTFSKPFVSLEGIGLIEFYINATGHGTIAFSYDFGTTLSTCLLDCNKQNAYSNYPTEFSNRKMNGDFPIFYKGSNTITFSGNLSKIYIYQQSRWF